MEHQEIKRTEVAKPTYPTSPDTEGFFYEDETDKETGIETKIYDNGLKIKRAHLPHSKRLATVRTLKAKETAEITRLMDKNPERYQTAMVTVATTLDAKKAIIEDVEDLTFKDFQVLMIMNSAINF